MGNIVKNHHSKFELNATRNDGALGFFQRASPPNNNNNNNNNKISSVWGPVPGPKTTKLYILIYIIAIWLDFSISNRNSEISLSSACTCLRPKKSIKANFPR